MADYWEPSKKLLADPSKFLDSLMTFDRDNIRSAVIITSCCPAAAGRGAPALPALPATQRVRTAAPQRLASSRLPAFSASPPPSESVIKRIEPYMAMDSFTPDAISKVSKACTSICMWVRWVTFRPHPAPEPASIEQWALAG